MKLFRIGLPLLAAFLLSGCIAENNDDCPPLGKVTLNYRLLDRNDEREDIFSKYISDVTMVVYDEGGEFVTWKRVDNQELKKFQGTTLKLGPGNYQVVCFGNVKGNTRTDGHHETGHRIINGKLTYATAYNKKAENGDDVFAAPRRPKSYIEEGRKPLLHPVTITESQVLEDTIDFTPFHRNVEVYVVGFQDKGAIQIPRIELTDMVYGYSFDMEPLKDNEDKPELISLEQNCRKTYSPEGEVAVAVFQTSYFDNDNSINIHIKRYSNGEIVHTINMKEFLEDNNIDLNDYLMDEDFTTVRILVTFLNGEVTITIPDWKATDVEPEF